MNHSILELDRFGVAFGERIILSSVTFSVPERGMMVLLGPGGTGKSTLLRTLAGFNNANPSLRTWGQARYAGLPLGEDDLPALVLQSARLMTASVFDNVVHDLPERSNLTRSHQRDLAVRLLKRAGLDDLTDQLDERVVKLPLATQRHLAILRLAAASPRLLCVDEPTTGLRDGESENLLAYLRELGEQRAVLVVLHNQEQARSLGGYTALLAGGTVQEFGETACFFEAPATGPGREFIRNGNCAVPAPMATAEELDSGVVPTSPAVPVEARHYVSDSFGPRGFLWLKKGQLAGTPRPGIFHDIDYDLRALQRVGVNVLISLTQTPVDSNALVPFGMQHISSPIPDMGAPTAKQAVALCGEIDTLLAAGNTLAVHCRAGLGRTGTVLAAYLVWEGASALRALDTVRRVEPRWVQSEEQVAFLEEFAEVVAKRFPARRTGTDDLTVDP